MSFVGRSTEIAALDEAWRGEKSAFLPIYGRRRTGKSRLIVEFAEGKPAIYHVGKKAPAALQRAEFLQLAAVALGEPLLAQVTAETWAQAFRLVEDRWKGPGKLLLALDEFQWTTESSPELGKKFFDYYGAVFADGALTAREKSLIALAVAHTVQCPYCIDAYTQDSQEKGADFDQMTEALHVAVAIRGGASLVHGMQMREKAKKMGM